ncbi:MAG TPA: hemolysin family protein [Polyangiaceae bacterium]
MLRRRPNPDLDADPPEQPIYLLLALLPAATAAVFAAASAAVAALSGARLAALQERLDGADRRAIERYVRRDTTIEARWLFLRVLCVAVSALLLYPTLPLAGAAKIAAAALLTALAYAIPSEIARAVVTRNPERATLFLLRLLRPVEWLVAPIADAIALLARRFLPPIDAPSEAPDGVTEAEVEIIVNKGELTGALDHEQSEMIRNVLDFGDLTAEDVMVPRTQVTSIAVDTSISNVLKIIAETQHSRYPVYQEGVDNVVGILHVKDLMHRLAETGTVSDATELASMLRQPVVFVPDSQPASTVLKDMRVGRHHLAVVIDEFGGFAGIVTLEDVIEEIVGDIQDEHDADDPPIVDLGNGRLAVDARIPVADLNRYLGTDLPDDGDYVSLGGLVVEQAGRVPEVGAKLQAFGLELSVIKADERHVETVELVTGKPTPETIPPPRSSSKITAALVQPPRSVQGG